jgi:hypothetical protein
MLRPYNAENIKLTAVMLRPYKIAVMALGSVDIFDPKDLLNNSIFF